MTLLISCVVASGTFVAAAGQQAPTQPRPTSPPQTTKPAAPPTGQPAAPAPKPDAPATGQPAAPAPAPVRRAPAAPATGRAGMAITVTTPAGATLPGIRVEVVGSTDRTAETNGSGQLSFPGMQAGTYRLRFSGEDVVTFEREVSLRAGQVLAVDVSLNPAPKPPPPPAPAPAPVVAAAPKAVTGPTGQPQSLSLVALAEREMISGRDARRDTLVVVQRQHPQHDAAIERTAGPSGCTRTPRRCTT